MSETQIKKLNLKALKPKEDTKTETDALKATSETVVSKQQLEPKLDQKSQEKATEASSAKDIQTQEASPKKISLLSIRKPTEEDTENIPQAEISDDTEKNNESSSATTSSDKKEQSKWVDSSVLLQNKVLEASSIEEEANDTKKQEEIINWNNKNVSTINIDNAIVDKKTIVDTSINPAIETKNENPTQITKSAENEEIEEDYEEVLMKAEDSALEKSKKWWFWFLKKSKKSSKLLTKNEDKKEKTPEEKKEEEVHFDNYTSSFEEQSLNVLKRIQNFKYAPSTRIWLLLSLVWVTGVIIFSLMVLFPEKHSPEIYKASILQALWKAPIIEEVPEDIINTPKMNQDMDDIDTDDQEDSSDITPSEKEIQRKEESKKKIKDYILNKYSN